MTRACPDLKKLPNMTLAGKTVADRWERDMRLYQECQRRHRALRKFYQDRDKPAGKTTKPG